MVCPRPTFRTKKAAKRHGAIIYGSKRYRIRKVKKGWRAYKK